MKFKFSAWKLNMNINLVCMLINKRNKCTWKINARILGWTAWLTLYVTEMLLQRCRDVHYVLQKPHCLSFEVYVPQEHLAAEVGVSRGLPTSWLHVLQKSTSKTSAMCMTDPWPCVILRGVCLVTYGLLWDAFATSQPAFHLLWVCVL